MTIKTFASHIAYHNRQAPAVASTPAAPAPAAVAVAPAPAPAAAAAVQSTPGAVQVRRRASGTTLP